MYYYIGSVPLFMLNEWMQAWRYRNGAHSVHCSVSKRLLISDIRKSVLTSEYGSISRVKDKPYERI